MQIEWTVVKGYAKKSSPTYDGWLNCKKEKKFNEKLNSVKSMHIENYEMCISKLIANTNTRIRITPCTHTEKHSYTARQMCACVISFLFIHSFLRHAHKHTYTQRGTHGEWCNTMSNHNILGAVVIFVLYHFHICHIWEMKYHKKFKWKKVHVCTRIHAHSSVGTFNRN